MGAAVGADAPVETWRFPASYGQERVWLAGQLAPEVPLYLTADRIRIDLAVTAEDIVAAFATVVDRHEALRTALELVDGDLVQAVYSRVPVDIPVTDLADRTPDEQAAALAATLAELGAGRFDLAAAPLWRARLLRFGDAEWRLAYVAHHTIADAASQLNLYTEVMELCRAAAEGCPAELPDLAIQYADYAVWHRDRGTAPESLDYWLRHLRGMPQTHGLLTDRPRPAVPTFAGGEVRFTVADEVVTAATTLARRHAASPFMVTLAGYLALVHRLTGETDVVVGVPVAGRDRSELAPLIGMFVNNVVMRVDVDGDLTFDGLVARVRDAVLDALDHQDVPFQKLVEALAPARDPSLHPLYQISFNYLPDNGANEGNGTARRDLAMELTGFEESRLEYSAELFDAATARAFVDRYLRLLGAAVDAPATAVADLPLLIDEEHQRLVVDWNDTAADYPAGATLHGLVEAQVARNPDAPAATFDGRTLTYAELDRWANRLAHALRARGAGPDTFVGVCAERSLELVVALLGVLKAGAVYVPLDPEYPQERLAFLVEDSGAPIVLTQRHLTDRLPVTESTVLTLDGDPWWAGHPETAPAVPVDPAGTAYLIYTSGSTGRPKGVLGPHRAAVNHIWFMQHAVGPLGPGDTMLQKTVMSADVSVREFLWPLMFGARLVLARPGGHKDTAYLRDLILAERVTVTNFVPSMLAMFVAEEGVGACRSLRLVTSGGEALPPDVARQFLARLPHCRLHNIYGPTETAMDVTWWPARADGLDGFAAAPLGRPNANVTLYVLDGRMRPQPVGVVGELFLGGDCLAHGYHRRPGLTAQAFVADPFGPPGARLYRTGDLARRRADGMVEFLGRIDNQVKLRGLRIELGEIEAALREQPGIGAAAVLLREDAPGDKRLVGYLAAPDGHDLDALRTALRRHLPDHMVPSTFVVLPALPQTTNGKLDRKALPAPERERQIAAVPTAPRTDLERDVAAVWADVLGLPEVGIDDDFFDLGGHSLLAIRVVAKLRAVTRRTGRQVGVVDLFAHPTVRGLAELVAAPAATEPDRHRMLHELTRPVPPRQRIRTYVCVPYGGGSAVVYQPLADAMPAGHTLYSVAIPGHDVGLDESALDFDELAARCAEEILERVEGPLVLYGHCSVGGGLVTELARRLEAAGREVEAVYTGGIFPTARVRSRLGRFVNWIDDIGSTRTNANWLTAMGVGLDDLEPEHAERILRNMRHNTRTVELYFAGLMNDRVDRLRAPMICVSGERDPLTEYAAERFREWHFLTDTSALVVLDEASHFFVKFRADELAAILTTVHLDLDRNRRADRATDHGPAPTWWVQDVSRKAQADPRLEPSLRRFSAVAAGQLVSMTGSALTQWAVPVWVYLQTNSLLWFGLSGVVSYVPGLIALPLAGAVADRYDRRKVIMAASCAAGGVEALMAALLWTDTLRMSYVYWLVVLIGFASTFQRITFIAAVPQLVPKRFLGHANGVVQLANGVAMLFMPLLAAGLLAAIDLGGILVIDMVSYVVAVGVLLAIRFPDLLGRRRRETLGEQLLGGLRYSVGNQGFRALLVYFGIFNLLLAAPLLAVTPLVLAFGAMGDVGRVAFAEALGVVVGGAAMTLWGGPRGRRMFAVIAACTFVGVAVAVTGLRPDVLVVAAGVFGTGLGTTLGQGIYLTLIERKVPQRFHGRVIALNQSLSWSTFPVGFAVLVPASGALFEPMFAPDGALATSVGAVIGTGPGRGIGFSYLVFGVLLVLISVLALRMRRLRRLDEDLPDAIPDDVVGLRALGNKGES